jgi:hypothetical protein
MAPTDSAAPSATAGTPDHDPFDTTTPDESFERNQSNTNATTSSAPSDAPSDTVIDEATTTHEDSMKGINKALALAHQLIAESGPVREPVSDPEPGPIHEDDREVFEMLDKRMAALQLQVQAIKQGFREMEGGSGEPDDS